MTMPLVLTNALTPGSSEVTGQESGDTQAPFRTRKARIVFQPVETVLPQLGASPAA
jgi:hypothetical protein